MLRASYVVYMYLCITVYIFYMSVIYTTGITFFYNIPLRFCTVGYPNFFWIISILKIQITGSCITKVTVVYACVIIEKLSDT